MHSDPFLDEGSSGSNNVFKDTRREEGPEYLGTVPENEVVRFFSQDRWTQRVMVCYVCTYRVVDMVEVEMVEDDQSRSESRTDGRPFLWCVPPLVVVLVLPLVSLFPSFDRTPFFSFDLSLSSYYRALCFYLYTFNVLSPKFCKQ